MMGDVRDDLPVLVTTTEAALLAHVEPVTIRQWVNRGKLQPTAQNSSSHLLFALADVFKVRRADTPDSASA